MDRFRIVVCFQVALAALAVTEKVPLELMEAISGALSAKGFDGTWISGKSQAP